MHIRTVLAAAVAALPLSAQGDVTDVVPQGFATVEGADATSFPFGTGNSMRAMYAYSGAAAGIDRPVRLRGIAFRPNAPQTSLGPITYRFDLSVSTSRNRADALDPSFENNHGSDKTRVFNGALPVTATLSGSTPAEFVLYIPFDEGFTWNPRCGALLLDIRSRGSFPGAGATLQPFDATTIAPGPIGRIAHRTDPNAAVANFPSGGTTQSAVMVAELDYDTDVAPLTNATTAGSSSSNYPWGRGDNTQMRVMYVYDGSAFSQDGRQQIHRLSFRPQNGAARPSATYDCKITMSTGTPGLSSSLNPVFATNEGADAKVVFDGTFTAPAVAADPSGLGFGLEVPLTETFSYNPAEGSLVIDIQLRGSIGALGTGFNGSVNSTSGLGRIFNLQTADAPTGTTQSFALTLAVSGYPQPTLPEAVDSTQGGTGSSFPWSSPSPMRVMYSYSPGAIQSTDVQQISHLRFRPRNSVPSLLLPATYQCTVDLSTRDITNGLPFNVNFDSNHGMDRVRAFAGRVTRRPLETFVVPAPWALEIKLDEPFRWDPSAGDLVVDIRMLNASGSFRASFDGDFTVDVERIAHRSDPDAAVADFGPQDFGLALSLNSESCNGNVDFYGTACTSGAGTLPQQSTRGLPNLPNPNFAFRLLDGAPNTVCAMLMGTAPTAIDLSIVGAPGCLLLATPDIASLPRSTDGAGRAEIAIQLQDEPGLAGLTLFTTWAIIDLSANQLGVYTSNGMRTQLCY